MVRHKDAPLSLPQVEADIKPFRGLLLGLFFTTTGGSIDLQVRGGVMRCGEVT